MRYVSTRGEAPVLGFEEVLLTGLARDGGLYVPEAWPHFAPDELRALAGRSYVEVACAVMRPFLGGEIAAADLERMAVQAYAGFRHRAVAPLKQLAPNRWLLELFHGPTLAFKDVAMQLLALLMDQALARRGRRATILGATSGDTGGAAAEAFRGRRAVDLFLLYPHGRVSEVQRRQMTTLSDGNVRALAIEGTFDDCQALVKAMFNDRRFRERLDLAGVNSINWARILAQTVYYFTAALALGAPGRAVSFAVPTGNFGDVFAGFAAKRMGLPVERLVVATNVNDILDRTFLTGLYERAGVTPTSSPSMDIEVSSNFERLLFEVHGRDPAAVRALMAGLVQGGGFRLGQAPLAAIRAEFDSARVDEAATAETIRATLAATGELVDPHTAVGLAAADRVASEAPVVALATAHPAKFPEAIERACGIRPELPAHLEGLLERPERATALPNDLAAVQSFVLQHARASREEAR